VRSRAAQPVLAVCAHEVCHSVQAAKAEDPGNWTSKDDKKGKDGASNTGQDGGNNTSEDAASAQLRAAQGGRDALQWTLTQLHHVTDLAFGATLAGQKTARDAHGRMPRAV
jgi:hypothetical protein